MNKKVTFTYSDSDEDEEELNDQTDEGDKDNSDINNGSAEEEGLCSKNHKNENNDDVKEDAKIQEVEAEEQRANKQCLEQDVSKSAEEDKNKLDTNNDNSQAGLCSENHKNANKDDIEEDAKAQEVEAEVQPIKKQCVGQDASKLEKGICYKVAGKSVDQLIEAELEELKDKSKVRKYREIAHNFVLFVDISYYSVNF